jgi:sulfate adenylyltransferase
MDRVPRGVEREAALECACCLPSVLLNQFTASDLEMISIGAFSPLTGFMGPEA